MEEMTYIPLGPVGRELLEKRESENMEKMWKQIWFMVKLLVVVELIAWSYNTMIFPLMVSGLVFWIIYSINRIK